MWRFLLTSLLLSFLLISACMAPGTEPLNSEPAASAEPSTQPVTQPSTQASTDASAEPNTSANPVATTEPSAVHLLTAAEGNLIPNPGAEDAENPAQPQGWTADSWGSNSSNLSWESSDAFSGEKYLSVTLANYQDGDAKWVFEPQELKPDTWYEYSDYYRSDGRSRLIWACTTPDNKHRYYTVWQADASKTWKKNQFRFYVSPTQNCTTSIMHILDHNGYLHTDHHQLVEVKPEPLKQATVSITFDDIYASAVDIGATELEKRGWHGSYYVAGKFARLHDDPEYAHPEMIQDLIRRGHELGSHSNTHPLLSTLNANDVIFEIQSNYDYLKFLGQAPEGMAYPFGDFSAAVEAETKRYHDYARTSLTGLNDQSADSYRLRILPITNATTNLEVFNWIDDAERSSTWLILLFHDLADGVSDSTYTSGALEYVQILDYLAEHKDVAVLPVNEALKSLY